jgi:hypothetical protein
LLILFVSEQRRKQNLEMHLEIQYNPRWVAPLYSCIALLFCIGKSLRPKTGHDVALSDGLNSGTGEAGGPEVWLIIYPAHWQTEVGRQFHTVVCGRVWKVWRIGARVVQMRGSGMVVRTWGNWGN